MQPGKKIILLPQGKSMDFQKIRILCYKMHLEGPVSKTAHTVLGFFQISELTIQMIFQ